MSEQSESSEIKITLKPVERVKNQRLYDETQAGVELVDISNLRRFYGPKISDDEVRKIETMMIYSFEDFRESEKWAGSDAYPSLNHEVSDPLDIRLKELSNLGDPSQPTTTAFANLEGLNNELQGHPTAKMRITDTSLEDEIGQIFKQNDKCVVWDIGCGGQAADILLLGNDRFRGKNLQVVGVGARDYGKNIRTSFPEFSQFLEYQESPIYSTVFPQNVADVVFSGRTIPYTGVMDVVRFTSQLQSIAKEDAVIWCGSIEPSMLSFEGSPHTNLVDYFEYLKNQGGMPSLRYSSQSGASIRWNTAEGFPFDNFVGYQVNYDSSGYPASVKYRLST